MIDLHGDAKFWFVVSGLDSIEAPQMPLCVFIVGVSQVNNGSGLTEI